MRFFENRILFAILILTSFSSSCITKSKNVERSITSEDNSKRYMKLFDENGVETSNIESLSNHGVIFTRAFSNAPVCSAAHSTLISGCCGPRTASHYHRKIEKVPMPDSVQIFPAYLRKTGYYTTNNHKEDYIYSKTGRSLGRIRQKIQAGGTAKKVSRFFMCKTFIETSCKSVPSPANSFSLFWN